MKLYIMRHGHAEQTSNADGRRPLAPHGRQALERLATFLAKEGVHVSHVMHSEKLRAEQTAAIVGAKLAPEHDTQLCNRLNPECDIDPLVAEINEWHDDTLVVGHMPFVSQLVSELVVKKQTVDLVRVSPGTIICLERHERDNWLINWLMRPEMIV